MVASTTSWLFLYVGAFLAYYGLYWSRQAYKVSAKYRKVVRSTNFLNMAEDAPDQEKISVMKTLNSAWPSTVSEMIHEKDEAHGTVLRAMFLLAAMLSLQTDIEVLSPGLVWTWEAY